MSHINEEYINYHFHRHYKQAEIMFVDFIFHRATLHDYCGYLYNILLSISWSHKSRDFICEVPFSSQ